MHEENEKFIQNCGRKISEELTACKKQDIPRTGPKVICRKKAMRADSVELAQGRVQRQNFVSTITNLRVTCKGKECRNITKSHGKN
jgi:hypothetical protein